MASHSKYCLLDYTRLQSQAIALSDMVREEDLDGIILNLVRIQYIYYLDPYQMARGFLRDKQTKASLQVHHILFIVNKRLAEDINLHIRHHQGWIFRCLFFAIHSISLQLFGILSFNVVSPRLYAMSQ